MASEDDGEDPRRAVGDQDRHRPDRVVILPDGGGASLMAEPAFGKLGFTVTKRVRVTIGGQSFDRCEMTMRLKNE